MTHWRLCWLKPRSLLIEGSAMLRIEASRMSMNWTMLSRSRMAMPRRDESVDVATVAGAGSFMSGPRFPEMWHPCGSWVDGARGRWGAASWPPPKPNRSLWPQAQEATLGAGTRLVQGARVETGQKLDLLERDAELGALEDLVGSGDAGGVLMAIEGPPGIGKTALMAEAKSRGNEAGMRVLS